MSARLAAAAALFGVASAAHAQTVDEIVARYLATRGGLERIHSVQSIRMTGTLSPAPGEKGPFRLELKRPGRMRVEMILQGTTLTQATDGATAWVIAPMLAGGGAVLLPPDEAQSLKDQADIEGPLVDWKGKGHKVVLVSREKRPGGEAYRLKVQLKSGDVRYIVIDAATARQIAEEGERPSPRGLVTIQTRLSDHRMVEGLLVPFVVEIGMKGGEGDEEQKIVFDKVELNVAMDDARFAAPPGAKAVPFSALSDRSRKTERARPIVSPNAGTSHPEPSSFSPLSFPIPRTLVFWWLAQAKSPTWPPVCQNSTVSSRPKRPARTPAKSAARALAV